MPRPYRYLPRSLRRQFMLAVGALALLILAGGLTAIYALRTSAATIRLLAEDRLAHMQDSQDMVQRTLLIERESFQLARAESLADLHASYADIVGQMERFDDLVARLASAGDDTALLELHQASQLFRNTANIVAQLRERDRQTTATQAERQATAREFDAELHRQASALVASAQALNSQYARAYRETITELAASSSAKERWVEILLAGSLLLAWLVAHTFLGHHVLARLQRVSLDLRKGNGGNPIPHAEDDEIDEMAHAVEQFQEDRRQLARRTEELLQARDAADAANKAKSTFLANMSHELRTPMNAILGFSSMMRREPQLSESQRENLSIINRSGEHLLSLINDVLEMAKIEAGHLQLEIAPFDLGGLVRDVSEMMLIRAQEKGLRLFIDQSSEFPRYVISDEARIRQILINLLGNAIKFTEQGSVTMRLSIENNTHHRLVIEVEDTGLGIAVEDRQRLFEPFVQLTDDAAQRGTGLGLTITRQFVQMLGGSISVDSTLGKGSMFRLDLPVELATPVETPDSENRTIPGEILGLAPGQPRLRILIAEDQRDNQRLLARLMTGLGLEVKIADNGEQCLALFQAWHPDLIWMDRRMPIMDGIETTRRLRQLPKGDAVKIVAVTASAFKEQQREMLDAGMDDFVRKPYHFSEIYDCLARQLGVQYIYRDGAIASVNDSVLPTALAALPFAMRQALRMASKNLDCGGVDSVIAQIDDIDTSLGHALASLAGDFDFPKILRLLEQADQISPNAAE